MQIFIKGFTDSLYIFKSLLPERRKNKQKYSQTELVADYLDAAEILDAHDALNDVLMLQKLINRICKNMTPIIAQTKSFNFITAEKERTEKTKNYKNSLKDLKISNSMKSKISKAGIDINILKKACDTGGIEALTILLGENIEGKPRVTKNKKVINNLFEELSKSI